MLSLDDIEDGSLLRKSSPAPHLIFGIPFTINCAGLVLFLIAEKATKLNRTEANEIYTDSLLRILRGQGLELYWRENGVCPDESDYMMNAVRKSSGYFNLVASLMQLFSKTKKDFSSLIALSCEFRLKLSLLLMM